MGNWLMVTGKKQREQTENDSSAGNCAGNPDGLGPLTPVRRTPGRAAAGAMAFGLRLVRPCARRAAVGTTTQCWFPSVIESDAAFLS